MTLPKGADAATKTRISERDKLHLDPNERAERVNTFIFMALGLERVEDIIAHPLYWDLVCFAQEFLNAFAFGAGDGDLMQLVRVMNSRIYTIHYSIPNDSPQLGPSREEHNKLWAERIEAF